MNRTNRWVRPALIFAFAAASALLLGSGTSAEAPAAEPPRMELFPSEVRPGEPVTVAFSVPGHGAASPLRIVLIAPDGRRLAVVPGFPIGSDDDGEGVFCAILAVPSTAPSGKAMIRLEGADGVVSESALELLKRDFMREEIDLDKNNTELRTIEDPKKLAEAIFLRSILGSFDPAAVFMTGTFLPPVDSSRRTSFFGDRRRYRYIDGSSDTTIHAGIDYGVPRGTPVRAAAAGRVVLSRPRIVTGNSIVLEHLPGVFTLYYHMDKLDVVEGQSVTAGQGLGLSGSTGLATGPHLHWEVRVSGEAADGDAFLARPVLDKDAVLSRISGQHDR